MQIAEQFKRSPWAILTGAVVVVAIILYAAGVDRTPSRSGISVMGVIGALGLALVLIWFMRAFTGNADKLKRGQQVQFAYLFALASFAVLALPPFLKNQAIGGEPLGIVSGCVNTTEAVAIMCNPPVPNKAPDTRTAENDNADNQAVVGNAAGNGVGAAQPVRNQWLVNIGGALTPQAPCPSTNRDCTAGSDQQRVNISGGLVAPLPVVIVALFGAAISLSRRVPEIQKQSEEDYVGNDKYPALTLNEAREYLAFQIMQFISAPLIAVTAYVVVAPTNEAGAMALAFMAGFGSESILLVIRGVAEGIQPKNAGTATADRVGSIEGVITADRKPVSADVTVRGTNLKTKSDDQGKYLIKQVPAGIQLISVLNHNTIQTRDVSVIAGATIPCDVDIAGQSAEHTQQRLSETSPAAPGSAISAPVTVDISLSVTHDDLDPGTLRLFVDDKAVPIGDDGLVALSLQPDVSHRIKATASTNGVAVSGERVINVGLDDEGTSYSLELA